MTRKPSLIEILDLDLKINVVDVGASYIEGEGNAVYKDLLEARNAQVIGFEPNLDVLQDLNKRKGPHEIYLPHAIADGKKHQLNICKAVGMTSILEPNEEILNCFQGFPSWGEIISSQEIETKRLDDIEEIEDMDFLKIDIQGAELLALKNATQKLKKCLVIQSEVEFLPMYKEQPLFGDIFNFLIGQGFLFHNFPLMARRLVVPLARQNDIYAGLNQVFWADAVFIKDFVAPTKDRTKEQMLKYCVILHDIYASFDIVLRTLFALDKAHGTNYANEYLKVIK